MLYFMGGNTGNQMPNLMYMTTYADMKSHDEHWKAFRNHPEWKRFSYWKSIKIQYFKDKSISASSD